MDDQSGDTLDPALLLPVAEAEMSSSGTAEFELRLRSTERVRTVVQRSCMRREAPRGLVVRIRESLIILKS